MSFSYDVFRPRSSLDASRSSLRSSLDAPRSSLRSSIDLPLTPPPSKRQSHLSKTLASAELEPNAKENKASKRERTMNMFKKVFGSSTRDSKPPPPRPPPHLTPVSRRESLSKRKAPNLTISIQPLSRPSSPPILPPLSPTSENFCEEPTPTSIHTHLSDLTVASLVSDVTPPSTPPKSLSARSQSPHRPALPYTMHHLTTSRESLNIPLNNSHSSTSLNDQYSKTEPTLYRLTHTADGLRIPRLEGEAPKSIGRGDLERRDKSPSRPSSFPSNVENLASKAMADQRRSVNLLELRSALGGWDCEADAEDAKEHVLEMKKKAMEREERKRRSWDLDKDWSRWDAIEQGGGRKEVRWNF